MISIYYIVRQRWLEAAVKGKSKNYCEVFKEVVISPLSLYMFLNVLMRVYFSSLRDRTDVIEYHVDPVTWSKQRKRLLFPIFKKYVKFGKVIMKTYNLLLSDFTFSYRIFFWFIKGGLVCLLTFLCPRKRSTFTLPSRRPFHCIPALTSLSLLSVRSGRSAICFSDITKCVTGS